jgi:Mrp family chromosome partitioning ATPase
MRAVKVLACYPVKAGVGKTATAVNLAWLSARTATAAGRGIAKASLAAAAYRALWDEVVERLAPPG